MLVRDESIKNDKTKEKERFVLFILFFSSYTSAFSALS
ncbi:hypothetical protein B4168_4087 [Anoxybacillus flavithermus]|nr:hypothetical protein B4168_4087 [Anoxybacillus flavithermus]OAO88326.1 hypothetical protein GT23_0419 [Parageobacillus thermoglucosidasius]